MKKWIMALVCLMTMVISANAQNGWETSQNSADELLGKSSNTSFCYTDGENGQLMFYSDDDKHLYIVSPKPHFFDANDVVKTLKNPSGKQCFYAIVGFYDIDNNLIKKGKYCFVRSEREFSYARSESGNSLNPKNIGKDAIKFLKKEKGYIRIVTPLYMEASPFDIKVPCMNN